MLNAIKSVIEFSNSNIFTKDHHIFKRRLQKKKINAKPREFTGKKFLDPWIPGNKNFCKKVLIF